MQLSVEAVTEAARARAGLRDFGPDLSLEGLSVFVDALHREAELTELVQRASEPFGPVDILVNNAAVGGHGTAPSDIPLALRPTIFEVNLQAPIDLTQQALPTMRARGYGRILNLLSETMHEQPIPHASPQEVVRSLVVYGASKLALERSTFGLAAELFGTGVQVNGFRPQRVCVTEENSPRALQALSRDPSMAESLEVMAEAAFLLVAGSYTGLSVTSRQLLQSAQQPVRSLDGARVVGDARSVPDLG